MFALGFLVGLGGALIPGPLLAFVIFDTNKKQKVTGPSIIAGHALWEGLVILLIMFGIGDIMLKYNLFIYAVGGAVLILTGAFMICGANQAELKNSKVNSSLLGGIFYTAFNPTQPPWWASAGLALLLQGYELIGPSGIITITAGHWIADLLYYSLISYTIYKYGKNLFPRQRQISGMLGLFVVSLGVYFIISGFIG
ncbi:MAG: LysE family translocator [Candidatus Bathyarchaeota archaeon]|nr:LysE family translocator [Candidatus Bathyarchaeota archaeon]MCX8176760.1 LysE family translocator [Candidatus Bathyarchaeota archaeon]MDW8193289.1 LysE family transporter [Nitrososphaerota archaeon]